jgi:hypothetical protein
MSDHPGGSMIEAFRQHADLTPDDLWWAYFALGGNATPHTVAGFLNGHAQPGRTDHDLLAHALNERFTQLGQDSPVPYYRQDTTPS